MKKRMVRAFVMILTVASIGYGITPLTTANAAAEIPWCCIDGSDCPSLWYGCYDIECVLHTGGECHLNP